MTTPTVLRPFRLSNVYSGLRGITVLTPWLTHLLITDTALSLLLPFSALFPTFVYHTSSRLAGLVWSGIQFIFTRINHADITFSGASLPQGESAILISNHVSWTDFYLIQHLAQRCNMLRYCRYFAKAQLKYVPFLGWGLWAMGMPLISRSWANDSGELSRVFRGPCEYRWPIWLVSFSEGTRYTPRKYVEAVEWCKKNRRPAPRYTLQPRTKGFVATVEALRKGSSVRAVYDVTVAYAQGDKFLEAPSMWESISRERLDRDWNFHVHVERFEMEIFDGMESEEIADWIEKRWERKGELLNSLNMILEKDGKWNGL